jgi:uncharacterized protein (TIGR02145 family)
MGKSLLIVVAIIVIISSCKKENSSQNNACSSTTVTDIDGNVYNTIKIGTQCWMQQNLKTTHYRDGSAIIEMEDSASWANAYGVGAWCYFEGNSSYNNTFGKLYNWYAATNPRQLCPAGWHIPTDSDFQKLSDYLGGNSVSASHMELISSLWQAPNNGADNSSGFSALPGGEREGYGSFDDFSIRAYFWTSTPYNSVFSWNRGVYTDDSICYHFFDINTAGHSIRCVGD